MYSIVVVIVIFFVKLKPGKVAILFIKRYLLKNNKKKCACTVGKLHLNCAHPYVRWKTTVFCTKIWLKDADFFCLNAKTDFDDFSIVKVCVLQY